MDRKPAGLIIRFVSLSIDLLIIAGINSFIGFLLGILSGFVTIPAIGIGCIGAVFLMSIPYFIIQQSHINRGQTPGMRALGLTVMTSDGKAYISIFQAMLRYIGSFINFLTLGITFVTVVFTPYKQSLADVFSNTLVFRNNKNSK